MKVIDLLNKIANGDENIPKTIKYKDNYYEYTKRTCGLKNYQKLGYREYLDGEYFIMNILKDEIEIIEETKQEYEELNKVNGD